MTSTALQSLVTNIQQNDYVSLACVTVIAYDYILTFSKEVEYIWIGPWTWVSTLFVLVRYSGLCFSISLSIFGSTFFPGPNMVFNVSVLLLNKKRMLTNFDSSCQVVYNLFEWNVLVFMYAATLAMILRVWALYNRSTLVLYILLTIYALGQISFLASNVIFETKFSSSAFSISQVLQFSSCVLTEYPVPTWLEYFPQGCGLTLGILMCFLTTIQFVKELRQKYKKTKRVRLNRYMKCLAREGMVYFMVVVIFLTVTILADTIPDVLDNQLWFSPLGGTLQVVPPVTLVPRFFLNLRELYAQDLQGRRGSNIDTGFGMGSGFEPGAVRSAIAFADPGENASEEQGDEMEMEIQEVARASVPA